MTGREKRERRIRDNPRNVSLEDFEALLRQYGFMRKGSKHAQAVIGNYHMTYKRTNPVKVAYVLQLLKYIDLLKKEGEVHEKRH